MSALLDFAGSYIRSRFLFECKRSGSVLYNVILITRGTIFFTPQNAQLLTRCHLIGISKVACWGDVPKLSAHAY